MIVTLSGANSFSLRHELQRLIGDFVATHTDMALERLDGDTATLEKIKESLQGMSFLSPRKMVVLQSPGKLKAFTENIEEILAETAQSTDLIIVEPKLDKRLTYYKTLRKKTDFREFAELNPMALAKWAVTYVQGYKGALNAADAQFLVDRLGAQQQLIASELDKLLLYNPNITRQNIALLSEQTPQSTIFELLNAAFAGDARRVAELYAEQRALKVEPQAIVAMLAWQLHVLAVIKTAADRSAADIARIAKLSPFVIRKSQGITRKLTLPRLKKMIADLLRVDEHLKTRSIDADEALQLYLLKLTS